MCLSGCATIFSPALPLKYYLYYKTCTKHFPTLLCTIKLAHSTSQHYFVLQSLHKVLPSTNSYCKACTKYCAVMVAWVQFQISWSSSPRGHQENQEEGRSAEGYTWVCMQLEPNYGGAFWHFQPHETVQTRYQKKWHERSSLELCQGTCWRCHTSVDLREQTRFPRSAPGCTLHEKTQGFVRFHSHQRPLDEAIPMRAISKQRLANHKTTASTTTASTNWVQPFQCDLYRPDGFCFSTSEDASEHTRSQLHPTHTDKVSQIDAMTHFVRANTGSRALPSSPASPWRSHSAAICKHCLASHNRTASARRKKAHLLYRLHCHLSSQLHFFHFWTFFTPLRSSRKQSGYAMHVAMRWCDDVMMWWCRGEAVMWRCGCGDVVMWFCGGVVMRWCGEVVM